MTVNIIEFCNKDGKNLVSFPVEALSFLMPILKNNIENYNEIKIHDQYSRSVYNLAVITVSNDTIEKIRRYVQ